jgi:hypothetical protein
VVPQDLRRGAFGAVDRSRASSTTCRDVTALGVAPQPPHGDISPGPGLV